MGASIKDVHPKGGEGGWPKQDASKEVALILLLIRAKFKLGEGEVLKNEENSADIIYGWSLL